MIGIMKSSTILSLVGVAAIMLIVGAALGSVFFSVTSIVTLTKIETVTQFLNSSETDSEIIQNYVSTTSCPTLATSGLALVNESSDNHQSDLAFLMKSGTAATLCVAYQLENDAILPSTINFSGSQILKVNASSIEGGYAYSYAPAPGITEKATPSILTIPAGFNKSRIIVNFTITATAQAKGFFALSYYEPCPGLIPFSIGYGTAQVNASDFEGFFIASSCSLQLPLSDGEIVGFGGMGTMILTQ